MASRMSKTWLIRITLIIAVLTLVGGTLSCNSSLLSEEAPDFILPTMTGAVITLSELEGTPVVLKFWATWCVYCRMEWPYFEAAAQESEGEITFIAIDIGESVSKVMDHFRDYEPTMIVALDETEEVFWSYCEKDNTRGYIPFTVFVDSEGIVQYMQIGAFQNETELWEILYSVFEL